MSKISIVTPVFNAAQFIEAAIQSVLNQNYSNVEYIIIDGGSTDGTVEIIDKYSSQLSYFISEKDKGQTDALNKGFAKATGDIYGWLNADEEYLPGIFNKIADFFNQTPHLDLVFGYRMHCNETGSMQYIRKYPPIHPLKFMLYAARVIPSDASFWSAEVHHKTGFLNETDYAQLAMDTEWFLRLSANVKRWQRVPIPLSIFKDHAERKTTVHLVKAHELGVKLTKDFVRNYNIPKWKMFVGWLIWGSISRCYEPKWYSLPRPDMVIRRLLKL